MLTWQVFVLWACVWGSSHAHSGSPITFTVHTRRSSTGQWQAEVDVQHGEAVRELVLTHHTDSCEGTEPTVHSKTIVTAENDLNGTTQPTYRNTCATIPEALCFSLTNPNVKFTCGSARDATPCRGPLSPGTKVSMSCKPGYMSRNNSLKEITCLKTGDWSGPVLDCMEEPAGYEFFAGLGWYQLYMIGNTFQEAKRICEFDGGNLGIVDSPGELEALQQLISRSRPAVNVGHQHDIYMGVRRVGGQEYVNLKGKPMTASYYFKWCAGRPPTVSQYGDCTIYAKQMNCHWDSACERKLSFLCEIPMYSKE